MKTPAKKAVLNVIIATAFAVLIFIGLLTLFQIRNQGDIIKVQNDAIKTQADIIREQTDINQRFFRCLVLIPPNEARTPKERVKLVDRCAKESKLPPDSSEKTSNADDQDTEDKAQANQPQAVANTQPQPTVSPSVQEDPDPTDPPPTDPDPDPAQQSLTEMLTKVSDRVRRMVSPLLPL